jgi:hypothetical protein
MDLTHIRSENGRTTLVTTRAALDEINAGMMGPTKRLVRQMSAARSSANIEYRDGRKVDIRPATDEEIAALSAPEQSEPAAPEWRTLKGIGAAGPFTLWVDEHPWKDTTILRPARDRKNPTGTPMRVTAALAYQEWKATTEDGRTFVIGGTATKVWAAA